MCSKPASCTTEAAGNTVVNYSMISYTAWCIASYSTVCKNTVHDRNPTPVTTELHLLPCCRRVHREVPVSLWSGGGLPLGLVSGAPLQHLCPARRIEQYALSLELSVVPVALDAHMARQTAPLLLVPHHLDTLESCPVLLLLLLYGR